MGMEVLLPLALQQRHNQSKVMKQHRLILLIALALVLIPLSMPAQQTVLRTSSRFGTNEYSCVVTQEDLANCPKWAETDEWPPLSPKKAIQAATGAMKGLVEGVKNWSPERITLRRAGSVGNWVYVVTMASIFPPDAAFGQAQSIEVVVLLDGKVVKPKVVP